MRTRPTVRGHLRSRTRGSRGYTGAVVVLAVLTCAAVLGYVMWSGRGPSAREVSDNSALASEIEASQTASGTRSVEVPALMGLTYEEAMVVLDAAGLREAVRTEDGVATDGSLVVVNQDPVSGVLASHGDSVTLTLRDVVRVDGPLAQGGSSLVSGGRSWVVCIDPGHQAHADSTPEPIGPKSKKTKQRVTGGATGVTTKIPEYELTLQIATNLKGQLEARGVEVVMTRTTSDVNISNSQRAKIANEAKADLFVRIHCDGSPDSAAAGVSTLYPANNRWTKPIAVRSRRAAELVQSSVVRSTGAVDRGVIQRTNLSGFNWSKVPAVLVECGFLSNPVEDRLLASPHYQDKLAEGIADGVIAYFQDGS